ncbi:MAG: GNAT family N-acetyltransferase [Paludibacteraceae bacterium]
MSMSYLTSDRITLRAPEPEDLDSFYRWENDTALWAFGNTIEPFSRYTLRQYIATADQDIYTKRQLRLMVERKADKMVVGAVDLFDFDPLHQRAGIGLLIDKTCRREGFAAESLTLLCNYAFGVLHLKQVYAHVPIDNTACLDFFDKATPFVHTATLRSWLQRNNIYVDVTVWQLINNNL